MTDREILPSAGPGYRWVIYREPCAGEEPLEKLSDGPFYAERFLSDENPWDKLRGRDVRAPREVETAWMEGGDAARAIEFLVDALIAALDAKP